ncbi:MAG: S8 family serine peptidase [Gemmatimonadetes bacterium]|uniref:S8 family serine peptidase n=1 Tax=Candidatus Kutchimonas denitrificans TaxID=3056748 RepID=A0AAE4Z6T9_9BACT|nr:S8 family serine peptidase [Gemmatimonadota bacterium]NIR73522.1 S8 family serine peptidase [Candidatus Kutchimonas denitrificans]NIR99481.1 S8 family serine peptidase [Gemmatimonadota bacterium]NIT65101.1 S8 family serine peptidase [Gemmatimonadota bacterium]NIV23634.1 S8 family serine peptidase [Gemmatimonadota bacterium]
MAGWPSTNNTYPLGMAPYANHFMYRADARDAYGRCVIDATAAASAVDQAVFDDQIHAINMSFSGPDGSSLLHGALQLAHDAGIVLVSSTGNTGENEIRYPAGYSFVLGVGALECNIGLQYLADKTRCNGSLRRAPFSTYGFHVGIAAVGSNVLIDLAGGGAQYADGTSYSAPAATAAAALVMAYWPDSRNRPGAIKNHLEHTAYTGTPYYNQLYMGAGVLDVEAAINEDPCGWQSCQIGLK